MVKRTELVGVLREVCVWREVAGQYKVWEKTAQISTKINKD